MRHGLPAMVCCILFSYFCSASETCSQAETSNTPPSVSQVTEAFTLLPLTSTEFGGRRAVWGDYDNDGDLDLAITGTAMANLGEGRVLRNDGGGSFSQVFLIQLSERPE